MFSRIKSLFKPPDLSGIKSFYEQCMKMMSYQTMLFISMLLFYGLGFLTCYVALPQWRTINLHFDAAPPRVAGSGQSKESPSARLPVPDEEAIKLVAIKDGYAAKYKNEYINGSEEIPDFFRLLDQAINWKKKELDLPMLSSAILDRAQMDELRKIYICEAWLLSSRRSVGIDVEQVNARFSFMLLGLLDVRALAQAQMADAIEAHRSEQIRRIQNFLLDVGELYDELKKIRNIDGGKS